MSAHPTPERLGAWLDGELDASDRAAVDVHLRECAECAAHLADLSAVDDAARAVPLGAPEGYFDDFAPRVRARLETRARPRWRPPAWGWAAAAALLLAVVTPLALQERSAPTAMSDRALEARPEPAGPAGDATTGRKQDAAPAAQAPKPPARGVPPQEADSGALAKQEQGRRNDGQADLRLERRDAGERQDVAGAAASASGTRAELKAKREEAAPAQEMQDAIQPAEKKLTDEQRENLRALGYLEPGLAAPPSTAPNAPAAAAVPAAPAPPPAATQQRQHGPRSQGAAAPRKDADTARFSAEPADKEQAEDAAAAKAAAGADAGSLQESVEVTTRSRDVGLGPASAKFRSLADGPPPRSDADARLLREAWRKFAEENPHHAQADEARVRTVEAGALAYRLGRRPQDREIALRDGRAYLERPATPLADRVRAALRTLEPAAR